MRIARPQAGVLALATLAVALAGVVYAAAVAGSSPGVDRYFEPAVGALVAFAFAILVVRVDPALTLSLGMVLSVFSGNWETLGFPIGIDRIIVLAGLGTLVLRQASDGALRRFRAQPIHWLLLLASAFAVISAVVAGTIFDSAQLFQLADRFGLVPFALFLAAPLAFPDERRRNMLLFAFVCLGAYLAVVAAAKGLGFEQLIFPSYINDGSLGYHTDRARGPFLEAGANGHALFVCLVAAAIAAASWRSTSARAVAGGVGVLCLVGIVFTLTRQAWLAAAVASIVTLVSIPWLRKLLLPAGATAGLLVVGLIAFVPGLADSANERFSSRGPVNDRLNSNQAAINMLAERPLVGFGWGAFATEGEAYYELANDYRISDVDQLHSVFLSNAVELGLLGSAIWIALLLAVFIGAIRRRGPPGFELWRAGFIAVAVSWVVVANFTPFAYAFSNYVVWLWAGLLFAQPLVRTAGAADDGARARQGSLATVGA